MVSMQWPARGFFPVAVSLMPKFKQELDAQEIQNIVNKVSEQTVLVLMPKTQARA